jgi:hypothetical protein
MPQAVNIVCKILDGALISGTQPLDKRMMLFMRTLMGVDVCEMTDAKKIYVVYREIGGCEMQILYTMHANRDGRRWHKHVITGEVEANACRRMMHDLQHMEYFFNPKNRWEETHRSSEMHQLFITREGEQAEKTAKMLDVYESDTEDEDCNTEIKNLGHCTDFAKTRPDEKIANLDSEAVCRPHAVFKNYCQHGRQKSVCKVCGGSGLCKHGRQKSKCKDCGTGYCTHGRQKSHCKDCGTGYCEHGRKKSRCKECGTGYCTHGRLKTRCKDCGNFAQSLDARKAGRGAARMAA